MSTPTIFPRWMRNADDLAFLPIDSLVIDPEDGTTYRKGLRGEWWVGGTDMLDVGALPPLTCILLFIPPARLSPGIVRRLSSCDIYDPLDAMRKEWDVTTDWLANPTL